MHSSERNTGAGLLAPVGTRKTRKSWFSGSLFLRLLALLVGGYFLTRLLHGDVRSRLNVSSWTYRGSGAVTDRALTDGGRRYDRHSKQRGEPEVLFLVLTRNADSWSKESFRITPRSVHDMLDLLAASGVELSRASIGIMTSSPDEYSTIVDATADYNFARTTVLYRPEDEAEFAKLRGQDRHSAAVQDVRRAALSRLRNYLMVTALEDERHIVWLDADVIYLSPGIVTTMISHSERNESAGIITARSEVKGMYNYDQNAWKLNLADWLKVSVPVQNFTHAESEYIRTRHGVDTVMKGSGDDALLEISSVGGTLLYMRGELVRKGLMFPWIKVVGAHWGGQGWVGLETEGVCYMAKSLKGGGCYVLGGSHHTVHA